MYDNTARRVQITIVTDNDIQTIQFTNIPLTVVEEAVAHINDNSGGN